MKWAVGFGYSLAFFTVMLSPAIWVLALWYAYVPEDVEVYTSFVEWTVSAFLFLCGLSGGLFVLLPFYPANEDGRSGFLDGPYRWLSERRGRARTAWVIIFVLVAALNLAALAWFIPRGPVAHYHALVAADAEAERLAAEMKLWPAQRAELARAALAATKQCSEAEDVPLAAFGPGLYAPYLDAENGAEMPKGAPDYPGTEHDRRAPTGFTLDPNEIETIVHLVRKEHVFDASYVPYQFGSTVGKGYRSLFYICLTDRAGTRMHRMLLTGTPPRRVGYRNMGFRVTGDAELNRLPRWIEEELGIRLRRSSNLVEYKPPKITEGWPEP